MTKDQIIALVIRLEGGYVNNPADPGGRTNMGITQKYLDHIIAHGQHADPTMPTDVAKLTVANVTHLYEIDQWQTTGAALLPAPVAALAFDSGVNQGPGTAVELLQQTVGVPVDKLVGPSTLAAVAKYKANYVELAREYAARRAARYASLNKPDFTLGWMRRLFTVYTAAIAPDAPAVSTTQESAK